MLLLYSLRNRLALLHKYVNESVRRSSPIIVLVRLSSCWVTLRPAVFWAARCLITRDASVPSNPALTLFGRARFIAWRLRLPFNGMPTGPEDFLGLPDVSGLRPCDWTHRKNGLVPHLYTWWGVWQIPVHQSAWHNHVCYHLRSGRIVTTTLDSQLSTN